MSFSAEEITFLADKLARIPVLRDHGRRLDVLAQMPPLFRERVGDSADARTHLGRMVQAAHTYPADGRGLLFRAIAAVERGTAGDPEAWQPSAPLTAAQESWSTLAQQAEQREPGAAPISIQAAGQGQIGISGNVAGGDLTVHQHTYPTEDRRYEIPDPAAAQATLEKMPLQELPPHAPWPQWSLMPYRRNRQFVGRRDVLRRLAGRFKPDTADVPVAIVTGMGGIGKTQTAIEFVSRYGQFFAGGVFWLNFAVAGNIAAEVARCGGQEGLALPALESLDFAGQVGRVRSEWAGGTPRLLVFDNCEDPVLVEQWRPKTGGCRVLVTSRRGEWPLPAGTGMVVQPLSLLAEAEEYRALLGQLAPHLTAAEMDQVAAILDYHPLALHVAGSYLGVHGQDYPVSEFVAAIEDEALQEESLVLSSAELRLPGGHTPHIYATFALSALRLDTTQPRDQLAQQALTHAALFAPATPLPEWLLARTVLADAETGEDERRRGKERRRFNAALGRLVQLGLVERTAESLRLHRLLADFVLERVRRRQALGTGGEATRLAQAQERVEAAVLRTANAQNNASNWSALRSWPAHLRYVTDRALERADEVAAGLANETAYFLAGAQADYAQARPYYERALAIREKVLGPEHPHTALSLNNLGGLLQSQGAYAQARPYYERALAIYEKVLGPEHPDTARSLNNLGGLLQSQGAYAQARPDYERALAIREKVLGPEHPHTALSLNNLGALLDSQGAYAQARPYYERALAIYEKVLGPEHPDTALSLNNLGALLDSQGAYAQARPYYERALAISEKVLGPEHPDTARSLNNLGFLLQSQGAYAQARPYYERALAIYEKVLGPEHPDTARSLNNLGFLLDSQGAYAQARPYYERALAIREKVLGPEHPDTALSLNNLGFLLQSQGAYAQARPYYERALAIREKVLGPEHPHTALSLNNLGFLLQSQGAYAQARPYFERALAIREKVLGPEHPDTALSLNNLGFLLQSQGAYAQARPYYERALAIYEKVLGPEHPDTALSLNNLGVLLDSQGAYAQARPYYERAVAIYRRALGDLHPDSITIMNNYLNNLAAEGEEELFINFLFKELDPDHPLTQQFIAAAQGEDEDDTGT